MIAFASKTNKANKCELQKIFLVKKTKNKKIKIGTRWNIANLLIVSSSIVILWSEISEIKFEFTGCGLSLKNKTEQRRCTFL